MPPTIKDPFRTPYGAFEGALTEAFKGVASTTPKASLARRQVVASATPGRRNVAAATLILPSTTWPCATLDRSRAQSNDYRVHHRAIQNRPYLDKFEAPEALDRCIRILPARSSFLPWFRRISAKSLEVDGLHPKIA